jgi:hypothetical protein
MNKQFSFSVDEAVQGLVYELVSVLHANYHC